MIALKIDRGAEFNFIAFGMHHHFLDNFPCSIKFGVFVTFLGISILIGLENNITEEELKEKIDDILS